MKRIFFIAILIFTVLFSFSQTLYVPYGTSGIGISGTGNVGVGTDNPISLLDVSNKSGDATLSISSALGTTGNSTLQFGTSSAWKIQAYSYSNGDKYDFGILYDRDDVCGDFYVKNYDNTNLIIKANGNIGIGTVHPLYKLDVLGTIRAQEIKVDLEGADFVFEEGYNLMPLSELESFVKSEKHLPEVAPAKEMETEGLNLSEMNAKLLQKIEELTLYTIEQQKIIDKLLENVEKQGEIIEKLNSIKH